MQDHLAARLRAAGFEEAEVTGRDVGLEREVELAEAPALAPVAQVIADGRGHVDMLRLIADAQGAPMTSEVIDRRTVVASSGKT